PQGGGAMSTVWSSVPPYFLFSGDTAPPWCGVGGEFGC
ncbi:hypothetical protein A2U01_0091427, partial [Trifolium medium]|nr:hypothetical protein [Trifolium medium]